MASPGAVRYAAVRGGGRVAFRTAGASGPSLVYIGGSASHQDLLWEEPGFRHLYGGLGDIARVLTIDRRGTGLSDPLPADASVETHVADIEAVLDAEGLTAASLSGTSDAARVAIAFAARHPDRVERLVLFGASASASHQLEPARVAALRRLIETAWGEGRLIALWAPSRMGDARFQAWAQRYERGCASPGQALKMMDLALSIDVSDDLALVAAPTLVMHRSHESLTPIADGREIAAQIPGAIFSEVPGTDAFTFSEDPELIRDEIATFMVGRRTRSRRARVFLAVLFTDIVGSTQLASQLGDERWAGLLESWDHAAQHAVEMAEGNWIKSTGDGALATFASPDAALECGLQLVQTSQRLGLHVRTGVHAGQCEPRGHGDVGGIAVHVAARIADLAASGKVLTSGTVRDLVLGSDWTFAERGEHELAGVTGSWTLHELADQYDEPLSPQSD
jgi:class 3 adenylate cyclase